jgi:hypothetical protein
MRAHAPENAAEGGRFVPEQDWVLLPTNVDNVDWQVCIRGCSNHFAALVPQRWADQVNIV